MKTIHRVCSLMWLAGLAGILFGDISMVALMSLGVITLTGLAGALLLRDIGPYFDDADQPVVRKVAEVATSTADPSPQLALPAATALVAER